MLSQDPFKFIRPLHFFYLRTYGAKKETLCTIAVDLCQFLKVDEGLITLFEKMHASRMGICRHEGVSDKYIFLRKMITNEPIKSISPGCYRGHAGEMWFARVLPPPFEVEGLDYSVVFTTPYILVKLGPHRKFNPFVEEEWLAYFARSLPKVKADTKELAYSYLIKFGLSRNYWNEHVFLSYRNHQHVMIFLEGFPDIPSSLPHTKERRERLGF